MGWQVLCGLPSPHDRLRGCPAPAAGPCGCRRQPGREPLLARTPGAETRCHASLLVSACNEEVRGPHVPVAATADGS